jgi:hypothetical protein
MTEKMAAQVRPRAHHAQAQQDWASPQKPRFLPAGDEVMSEKWPQAIFPI